MVARLAIFAPHPVQYTACIYELLAKENDIATTVYYSTLGATKRAFDKEFQQDVQWDIPLLDGYRYEVIGGHGYQDPKDIRHLFANMWRIFKSIRRDKPQFAMIGGWASTFEIAAIVVCLVLRVKILLRPESSDDGRENKSLRSTFRSTILRFLYKRVHAFLYIGQNAKDSFTALGGDARKLEFSPYAVNNDHFQRRISVCSDPRNIRQALGIPDSAMTLLFCGKFIHKKDPKILLSALIGSPALGDVHLIMVGDGELRPELQSIITGPDQKRVHFVGFKNQSELSPYYLASDVLVLPSIINETWGLVVNEAMLHGLTVIVSDRVGSRRDLVDPGVTGQIFRHGDVADLQESLHVLLRDPPKLALMKKAAQLKIQRFTPQVAAAGIVRGITKS